MAPEHTDGLDDQDVPSRTAVPGESELQIMRRTLVYAGTRSASTPEGSMERLGTVSTAAGRRSARLTSSAATGGGIASEDAETQAIVSHSLQAEQQVIEQLRAELPLPTLDDDFPETGGEALPGAEYEVDYVEPPAQFDTTTGGTVQDTVEGPPAFDFHRPASEVARLLEAAHEAAGIAGQVDNSRSCINHEHCGRAHSHSVTMNLDAYCCDECAHTNGRIHADDCSAVQVIGWHVPGSAAMESTLNDDTLTAMRF